MSDLAAQAGPSGLPAVGRLSSDERLTRRAAEGDERAFAAIYRRYGQDLYRYCAAILGDSQEAQDALQNTMVKVMRALPDERREIRLKPWLYRIAHNEAIDLVRSRRPSQELDPELEGRGLEPSEQAEQRAQLRRLLVDLEDLPERQRGALLMRELAGLSFEEIGESLGATPAAVRQTIYEARLNLKQMIAGRETSCTDVMRALSDADGRVVRRRDIRAHLRHCESCHAFRDQIKQRRTELAAIAPLPAATAAGILHGLLGGGHGPGAGGGILGALGGGAGKAVGGSVALKSAAAVVAVAVVGAGVADRSGLIHIGTGGGGTGGASQTQGSAAGSTASDAAAVRARTAASAKAERADVRVTHGQKASRHAPATLGGSGSAKSPAAAGASPATPGNSGAALAEDHVQNGHPELPAAAGKGQETAAGHQEGEAPTHPAPPEHHAPSEHPTAESHPGGSAPSASPAPEEAGAGAAGGNPPKAPPPGAGAPAEPGPPAGHGPPAESPGQPAAEEHGPGAHGPG